MSTPAEQAGPAPAHRELPDLERGRDLSRILAFTDGVFAIAITLLVLQIEVPQGLTSDSGLLDSLSELGSSFIAYGISFAVIGLYWIVSHRSMRTLREYDGRLLWFTLLYLAFIVMMPFSSDLMGQYGDRIPLSVVFYILNLVAINVSLALTFRHVLKAGLAEPGYEWRVALGVKSNWLTAGFFLLTTPFAWLIGAWTPVLWILLRFDPFRRRLDHAGSKDA